MNRKSIGRSSVVFSEDTSIKSCASVVGEMESQGPIGDCFDRIIRTERGNVSWEECEYSNYLAAIELAIKKAALTKDDISTMIGGDLLNQIISSGYSARNTGIPFLGIYGACSNLCESILLGACLHDGGFAENVVCATSSHFCTAERQYRGPIEQGGQRPPHAQHTVTGSGAYVICQSGSVKIEKATIGKVVDYGIEDPTNMGAAMAPAAADTIRTHLSDFNLPINHYDLYITGDLGTFGSEMLYELLSESNIELEAVHRDCGCEIYDRTVQDVDSGGSGCGCSAVVLGGYFLPKLISKDYKRILMVATGALMSPISNQQGETIPGIAHAIALCVKDDE